MRCATTIRTEKTGKFSSITKYCINLIFIKNTDHVSVIPVFNFGKLEQSVEIFPKIITIRCLTGTLTANKMTARAIYTNENDYSCTDPSVTLGSLMQNSLGDSLLDVIAKVVSIATMNESVLHFDEDNNKKVTRSEGNPTECALLNMVQDLGFHYIDIRNSTRGRGDSGEISKYLSEGKQFEFSSSRKMMSWAVPIENGGGYRIYSKGASEVIAPRCIRMKKDSGELIDLTKESMFNITKVSESYARRGMRCLSLAYRDLPTDVNWEEKSSNVMNADGTPAFCVETDLVFVGLVGIENPLQMKPNNFTSDADSNTINNEGNQTINNSTETNVVRNDNVTSDVDSNNIGTEGNQPNKNSNETNVIQYDNVTNDADSNNTNVERNLTSNNSTERNVAGNDNVINDADSNNTNIEANQHNQNRRKQMLFKMIMSSMMVIQIT